MTSFADHVSLEQENFNGLFARGLSDTTGDSFFTDCLNNKYTEGDVLSRDGLSLSFSKSNIVRIAVYKRLNESPRFIILDTSGNLYDSLFPNNPIYTDATFLDFSGVSINNRYYITPHNRQSGIANKSVLVYEGSGTARLAAGLAPSGFTLGAANSASAGNCEAGYHLLAVAYLTSSGFITAPGPTLFALLLCTGGFKIDLSALPIGPSGTVARVLLSTKSIPSTGVLAYNGNQFGYELFFIPNGIVQNNSSTTASVSFFDADLINSADYLLDNLPTIPAGVGVTSYAGRLISWGEQANQHTLRVSEINDPETINSITGVITIDPSAAVSGVRNCSEFRKSFIIGKSNRLYGTADNGSDPSTWVVTSVDLSVGTECFGINTVLDARGNNNDRLFIADRSGLICFEGVVKRPEMSYNIEDIWKRINKAYFSLVQVVDDPVNHRLIISVPLDSATAISHILYGDYSKSFTVWSTIDVTKIKWSIWTFPNNPVSIVGDVDATTFQPVIHFAMSSNIYDMLAGNVTDYGTAIDSWFKTSLKSSSSGWINHFAGFKMRVKGSGTLILTLYGEDDNNPVSAGTINLSSSPGMELDRLINYKNEKLAIKFRVNSAGDNYVFSKLILYAKALWLRRPA